MDDDQFTKLFKYIEDFRAEVNTKLDQKASQDSMERLLNTLDGFLKRLDDIETEQSARDLQFERLLDWAREVSKKTGVPLKDL
jgi:septal ring factor EnvC (AmiA/AmiB activator)